MSIKSGLSPILPSRLGSLAVFILILNQMMTGLEKKLNLGKLLINLVIQ